LGDDEEEEMSTDVEDRGEPHAGSSISRAAYHRNVHRLDEGGGGGGEVVAGRGGVVGGEGEEGRGSNSSRPATPSGSILRPSTAGRTRATARPSTATARIQVEKAPSREQLRVRPMSALPSSHRGSSRAQLGHDDDFVWGERARPASAMSMQSSARASRPASSMSRQSNRSSRDGEYQKPRSKMLMFDQIMAKNIDHGLSHRAFARASEEERRSRPSSALSTASTKKKWPSYQESTWTREKTSLLSRSAYSQQIKTFYVKEGKSGRKQFATISSNPQKPVGGSLGGMMRRQVRDPLASENYEEWLRSIQENLEAELEQQGELDRVLTEEEKRVKRGKQRRLEEMYEERRMAASASDDDLKRNLRKTQRFLQSQQPGWNSMHQFEDD
jgi:hypothetical protein